MFRIGNCWARTGAKTGAHDAEIFPWEAGLLLQLTLQEEGERQAANESWNIHGSDRSKEKRGIAHSDETLHLKAARRSRHLQPPHRARSELKTVRKSIKSCGGGRVRSKPHQSLITKAEWSRCSCPSRSSDGLRRPAVPTYCIRQHRRKLHLTGLLSLLKTMTQPLSFSSPRFFSFHGGRNQQWGKEKNDPTDCVQREKEELGQWFILPQKHSCVHQIHKQERARSQGKICSRFPGPLAALTAWPWAGKQEKQFSCTAYWTFIAWELINRTNLLTFSIRWLILYRK